jgi:CheY-like chemotaxis protein
MIDSAVILLAEDDENQVVLIRRVFKQAHLINPLHVVTNGEEVIAYLKGEDEYANRAEYPLPALLLLDLKMPRKNGFEVLKWIRQQPGLRTLRVVVLTSSEDMADVNRAYQLGANSFLVKPGDFEQFVSVIQTLQGYWLWISEAPDVSRSAPETKPST